MKEIKLLPNHIKPKLVHNEPLTGCQDGWVHILSFVPIEVGDTLTSIKDYFMFARVRCWRLKTSENSIFWPIAGIATQHGG